MGLGVLGFLLAFSPRLEAAPDAQMPTRTAPRTNAIPGAQGAMGRTNAVKKAVGSTQLTGKTNAAALPQTMWAKGKAQTISWFDRLRHSPAYYPVVIGAPLCLLFALIFLFKSFKAKSERTRTAGTGTQAASLASRPVARQTSKVYSCNVLEVGAAARHLWHFDADNGNFVLNRQQTSLPGETLPSNLAAKNWRTLFQRKLNIAWLPAEQVFLRVAQFPRSDFNETLAMVELQLEKLSPIPVAQIVWSIHVLPHTEETSQTVIVMIVARNVVEEFLGQLEGQGYLADRLELPLLDQLQATPITEDGAWIYPQAREGETTALVAWWYGRVLQNLDLLTLPAVPDSNTLKEQLLQMAWAGEMDGWLKGPPHWHLVADAVTVAKWEPALREASEQPIAIAPPLPAPELAALTARRAAHSDPRANLLPIEFTTRYQQQFVDRLWMRGLLAIIGLYLLGVAVYAVALGFATFRTRAVENNVAQISQQYTNAIQLKSRYQVLQDGQELKFAALECWNLTARYLPDSATLDTMNFIDGKKLSLSGKAPKEQWKDIIEFEGELRKATGTNGDFMFDQTKGEHAIANIQGGDVRWNFSLELKRVEVE